MAATPRRRALARWAVLAGSAATLAGFWAAIARGPQPPGATALVPPTPAVPRSSRAAPVAPAAPAAPASRAASPRLRTRAS